MSSRLTFDRSSFRTTSSCLLFALLLSGGVLTAEPAVSGADKPKEDAENSGAPDVSYALDEFLDRCLAQPNHGSTAGQIECINRARQGWDGEMNHDYRRLADHLGPKARVSLRNAQRRWLQYRDADQPLIDSVYRLTRGTMFAPLHAYSRLRLVRERSLILKSYFTALTNPTARQAIPRAGQVKENLENSGNLEVDYPADDFLDDCFDQHAGPTERVSCLEEGWGRWDEAMNDTYLKLNQRLPSKSRLAEAQRAWLVFRDAENLLIDSIYETLPSQEYQYRTLRAYWRLRLIRERALLLKKYLALASSAEATN